jgi:hypothetical protein
MAQQKIALFCSTRAPGDVILRAYDTARKLRDDGITVISAFILLSRKIAWIFSCGAINPSLFVLPVQWKKCGSPRRGARLLKAGGC